MLDLVGYQDFEELSHLSVLEPSCGEGEFLVEVLTRLQMSASRFGFDFKTVAECKVDAFELDENKISVCQARILDIFPCLDFSKILHHCDFLTADIGFYDIVVGNPPYVRYERLTDEMKEDYKLRFKTFHYRADLYVPFYEKTLNSLSSAGRHCFICSNRWLKCEYGRKLRRLVSDGFTVSHIIDLEKARPFQDDVSAYTDIVLIVNSLSLSNVKMAKADDDNWLSRLAFSERSQPRGDDWSPLFIDCRSENLVSIEKMGADIGIGVATGATKLFVGAHLVDVVERELLLPAIDGSDLRGDTFRWHDKFLLNPYDRQGALIDLGKFPRCASYLNSHRQQLAARHTAQKNPNLWYKTIDRINSDLTHRPKILLPDMTGNRTVFVDEGRFYPLHNIYYITGLGLESLRALAAILMSSFARRQLSSLTNAMNGGYARWQSQHLRKMMLPNVALLPPDVVSQLSLLQQRGDVESVDAIVNDIVGC